MEAGNKGKKMLANNVQETTTTTGTGNITLAGASENGRTFTSQFQTNQRFTYFIDDGSGNWESGIGYLSSSTVLVREKPQDGSATTPVNFAAGTKQVFVAASNLNVLNGSSGHSTLGASVKFSVPSNLVRLNSNMTLAADRLHFVPALITYSGPYDLIGVRIVTGAGTSSNKMHLGLYDINPTTGEAGTLLFSATNIDPSVAGMISASIPTVNVTPGWYYMGLWCDTTPSIRANDQNIMMHCPTQVANNSNLQTLAWQYINSQAGLTDLPATGNANNATFTGNPVPAILLGKS